MGQGGAGKQRIDYATAERMLRDGATQGEVAEHFDVTQSAVAVAIRRGNINYENTANAKGRAMPWTLREEHQQKYLARMLRAHHRREQGLTNAPVLERMLESFLRTMSEADSVITYRQETEDGFLRIKRRPGVDDHPVIRRDDLDDNGQSVRQKR